MNKSQIQDLLNSPTFCSHLALSATVYPGSRWVPCCKSNGDKLISAPLMSMTLQQYKNSAGFQSIQHDLSNGVKNEFCSVCKDVESAGGKSDRQSNNENWLQLISKNDLWHEFDSMYQAYLQGDYQSWHWYLFVDNQCQARCVMCDPVFSTSLKKEYEIIGWKHTEFAKDRSHDSTINDPQAVINEFKKHAHEAKILQLLGGEPTLSKDCFELLQWLVDQDLSKKIALKINTNGIKVPKEWLAVCKNFQACQWSVSVDALGDLNHWIRYPTNWTQIESTVASLSQHDFFIMIKTTVHALNAHYIPEVYDWAKSKKLLFHVTPVYSPLELGIGNLNDKQRQSLSIKYQDNKDFYQAHGKQLLDYLDSLPCQDQTQLKGFLYRLQPHRPAPFGKVNEFFSEKFF